MRVDSISTYQSAFLHGDDLPRPVTVTIERVTLEEFYLSGKSEKMLTLSFAGKQKRLVLNKTRAAQMVELYGDETDDWNGKVVRLFPTTQSGKKTIHIRKAGNE